MLYRLLKAADKAQTKGKAKSKVDMHETKITQSQDSANNIAEGAALGRSAAKRAVLLNDVISARHQGPVPNAAENNGEAVAPGAATAVAAATVLNRAKSAEKGSFTADFENGDKRIQGPC